MRRRTRVGRESGRRRCRRRLRCSGESAGVTGDHHSLLAARARHASVRRNADPPSATGSAARRIQSLPRPSGCRGCVDERERRGVTGCRRSREGMDRRHMATGALNSRPVPSGQPQPPGTAPAEETAIVNPARVARHAPPRRIPRPLIILASNRRSRTDRTGKRGGSLASSRLGLGPQATSANLGLHFPSLDRKVGDVKVGQEPTLRVHLRMAHIVAGHRAFPADIAALGHRGLSLVGTRI